MRSNERENLGNYNMATLETLLRWIRGRKQRQKNAHAPASKVTKVAEVTSETSRSEVSPCQCRASMKLPPIPREARRLAASIPRPSDSPAHIYEEIPYSTTRGRDSTTTRAPPSEQVEEYLAPSDEKSRNLRRLLLKAAKCSAWSAKVNLKDTCEYSNVSPLSALGLGTDSFRRCTKCQRPHGVYNSTVYAHNHSTSGSPDLITFDRCQSTPALDDHINSSVTLNDRPHNQRTPLSVPAPRSYSICDLREITRPDDTNRSRDVLDDTQTVFCPGGRKDVETSAFRVVARGQRTIHSSLRKKRRAKVDDYEYYLTKVKQNLKLENDVYAMSKVKPRSAGSDYHDNALPPHQPLAAATADGHAQRMRSVTKSFHDRVTALKGNKTARPPCLRRLKSDVRRHSLPSPMVAMTTDQVSVEGEDYEIPIPSRGHTEPSYDPLEKQSDVDLSDKLSCRATNYVKGSSASSCYGSLSTASLDTYYSSSMYGNHGNATQFKHNPLLSDIMRRNHDRQNLFI